MIAKWLLENGGLWGIIVLSLATVVWYLERMRNALIERERARLETECVALKAENKEIRERYSKTLLGLQQKANEAVQDLIRLRRR